MSRNDSSPREVLVQVVQEQDCAYLPGRDARLCYRLVPGMAPARYQELLERGWRRFGCTYFRPVCAGCAACRSLRIDVARFAPSRSMRRTAAKNRDLDVLLRPASLSRQHLELYDCYHRDMATRKGWSYRPLGAADYHQTYVEGRGSFGHELLYVLDGRLLAVALVDLLPRALSAVYCFYDPAQRARGLGIYSVLRQVELARARDIPFVYLGFCVEGNASTRYKSQFVPHEILCGRPGDDEPPIWRGVG